MGVTSRSRSAPQLAKSVSGIAERTLGVPTALVLLVLLFVAAVAGIVTGWQRWGRTVVARPIYRIATENIRVTPPPPWVRSDVRAEVVRYGALNDLTVFDKDVTIRVYQAFELHPWIAKVRRVSKHPPAQLDVDVDYRRPVACVEVPRGVMPGNTVGVIPVDGDSVVLPTDHLTEDDMAQYLRLTIPGISPCGLAGNPWGDPRVLGAARIAELLNDSWQSWKLFRIRLISASDSSHPSGPPTYQLETRGRKPIVWGYAPDEEQSGDPSAAVKLSRLRRLAATVGDFDQASPTSWDLRDP